MGRKSSASAKQGFLNDLHDRQLSINARDRIAVQEGGWAGLSFEIAYFPCILACSHDMSQDNNLAIAFDTCARN